MIAAAPLLVLLFALAPVQAPLEPPAPLPSPAPASPMLAAATLPAPVAAMPVAAMPGEGARAAPQAPALPPSSPAVVAVAPSRIDDRLLIAEGGPPLARIFGLGVRTVVLDPGHGGRDPGAVARSGLAEKAVTLAVAETLAGLLREQTGLRVLLTRNGDETVPLARRVEIANAARADLFVSIHVNALPNRRINAIETYYFGTPDDPATLRLAELENSGSELPIAAFKALVDKLGATLKRQESLALAQSLQASLIGERPQPAASDERTFDGGVRVGPFVVLLGVEAPAVLTEIGCLSSRREAQRLATLEYRAAIAGALASGITGYLRARLPHTVIPLDGAAEHEPSATEGASLGQDRG